MQQTTSKTPRSETQKRRDRARSRVPTSGDGAPASDGDGTGRVTHDDLFGSPALDTEDGQEDTPADVWGDPEAEPVQIPSLPFTAYPPERALYAAAYRAAYKYPDALMLVMNGVRKGLERGKKAAESRGDSR